MLLNSTDCYEWHISIILQYTNDLEILEYPELISAIKRQRTGHVKFTIFKYEVPENHDDDGTVTILKYSNGRRTLQRPIGKKNLYSPDTLVDFFNTHVVNELATRHLVILLGHGAGLGYFPPKDDETTENFIRKKWLDQVFKEDIENDEAEEVEQHVDLITFVKANLSIDYNLNKTSKTRFKDKNNFFTLKANDIDRSELLTRVISAKTLATIFKTAFKTRKIEILVAQNCYCQMFEAGYELKDQVNLLVASQTTYPSTGFNYDKLFDDMRFYHRQSNEVLAENIVYNFQKKYTPDYFQNLLNKHSKYSVRFDRVSISCNRLSKYKQLFSIINKIADFLNQNMNVLDSGGKKYIDSITTIRDYCQDLSSSSANVGIIDLTSFIQKLVDNLDKSKLQLFNNETLDSLLTKLSHIRRKCNIAIVAPVEPQTYQPPKSTVASASPFFLSIFMPPENQFDYAKAFYQQYYSENAPIKNSVPNDFKWRYFVRNFLKNAHPNDYP